MPERRGLVSSPQVWRSVAPDSPRSSNSTSQEREEVKIRRKLSLEQSTVVVDF